MDQKFPKIFVIVLNFNGAKTLPGCLASVFQSDYPNFETVVVDNNSQDGSFEKARLAYSKAHFIKNSANIGFAKGNNVGIRFALEKFADHIFVLNNDAIIENDALSLLAKEAAKNPAAGIFSPIITTANGEDVWFAGGLVDWLGMKNTHITKPLAAISYKTDYVSGCAMLIKKDVFKKIGLFDERYFLYYEDADFSLRANKAGFDLLIVPSVSVRHLEQSNTNNKSKIYWLVLSGLLFFDTHTSWLQKFWTKPYLMARKIKNLYDLVFSPSDVSRDIRKAYRDYKKIPK
ncbi:MAG: glycosyltransferase family 2 protein [Candidatus Moranbacteria bacterium]|nr:glycosyltransferase family 2 protein [Candidatus Moranbacteria bacterium]